MEKYTHKTDVWAIFPAIGVCAGERSIEIHIQWLRTDLVLTFKRKKHGGRKSN